MAYLVGSKGLSRYIRRYLRIFSWKRLANASQVLMSMLVSWVMRRPVVWGQPFLMMVEPTNFCNLKCPLCPSGNGQMRRPRGNMSIDDFKQLVDQVADVRSCFDEITFEEPVEKDGWIRLVGSLR